MFLEPHCQACIQNLLDCVRDTLPWYRSAPSHPADRGLICSPGWLMTGKLLFYWTSLAAEKARPLEFNKRQQSASQACHAA